MSVATPENLDNPEIPPSRALALARAGRVRLVDIRSEHERVDGMAAGALAMDPDAIPGGDPPPVLICRRGIRSGEASARLRASGMDGVLSVTGGMEAWITEGLPVDIPDSGLDASQRERYRRHLAVPGVGVAGQKRLLASRVLIVGAGGLGSPASLYLAGAGVGHLVIVDDDAVERSNLQRQILHDDAGIGAAKADSARRRLTALNPEIRVDTRRERLADANADALVRECDVVVDGSDNFPTRYRLNDACIRHDKPLVYGAVEHFAGQVSVFAGPDDDAPCYRCLFPEAPGPGEAPNCAEAGVLGMVPGVIGCLQAAEAVKLLLGIGRPLSGRLLHYDALGGGFRETRLRRDPECPACGARAAVSGHDELPADAG